MLDDPSSNQAMAFSPCSVTDISRAGRHNIASAARTTNDCNVRITTRLAALIDCLRLAKKSNANMMAAANGRPSKGQPLSKTKVASRQTLTGWLNRRSNILSFRYLDHRSGDRPQLHVAPYHMAQLHKSVTISEPNWPTFVPIFSPFLLPCPISYPHPHPRATATNTEVSDRYQAVHHDRSL